VIGRPTPSCEDMHRGPRLSAARSSLASAVHETPGLEQLLRRLIREAGPATAVADSEEDDRGVRQELVLELELDGVRYTLHRTLSDQVEQRARLSPREREIVRLIARGLPNKTIAAVLDVSLWTVATHLRRIFAKLGVNSRAEMVARAMDAGLLDR
jgi:DNA-binding CsgD family transcriptional regulator